MSSAQIGFGQVRHTRLRPARHAFDYPTFFVLLPMRALRAQAHPVMARNRFGWLSFVLRFRHEFVIGIEQPNTGVPC